MLGAEELVRAVDRKLLDLVHDLAATVVALARIPLGVLVRRRRADRFHDRRPGEVLGRDQLDLIALAIDLAAEQLRDLRIELIESGRGQLLEGLLRDGHLSPLPGVRWIVLPRPVAAVPPPEGRRLRGAHAVSSP